MKIAIVDYGMGNLRSVAKAIEHVGPREQVVITSSPKDIAAADRVVFPGQGAMPDCMRELNSAGLAQAVVEAARNKPFFGICIGLQMLFERSEEGDTPGLGILPGHVERFHFKGEQARALKVPHMGWNEVMQAAPHPLWHGIDDATRFYFVHSYFAAPRESALIAGQTDYGLRFTAACARDNIFATQFHPEKSHAAGLRLLSNFLSWKP